MSIGILLICTGKYSIFFQQLFESSEKYFLNNHKKTYYLFTDADIEEKENVRVIKQSFLGWPYDTMKRFHMFNSINNLLIKEDYLFFLNANMKFVDYINEEVMPSQENDYLMGVNHPAFYTSPKENFTYERRKESCLHIPITEGKFYYQGCFNGGKSDNFLEMSKTLSNMIDKDLSNGIIPIWHDESALNWYYKDKNPLLLSPSYAYPESWSLPLKKMILQLDKNKFGGYDHLRQNKK